MLYAGSFEANRGRVAGVAAVFGEVGKDAGGIEAAGRSGSESGAIRFERHLRRAGHVIVAAEERIGTLAHRLRDGKVGIGRGVLKSAAARRGVDVKGDIRMPRRVNLGRRLFD